MAPRHRLDALDGELVGLAQRLDIAPLRGPNRLDIEGPEAEIGEQLGHIEIEEVGTGIRNGGGSDQGYGLLCSAQRIYRQGKGPVNPCPELPPPQRSNKDGLSPKRRLRPPDRRCVRHRHRSEEHTSELQSPYVISYAV